MELQKKAIPKFKIGDYVIDKRCRVAGYVKKVHEENGYIYRVDTRLIQEGWLDKTEEE